MIATLFSQVPIMQFQKQGIKYIYIYIYIYVFCYSISTLTILRLNCFSLYRRLLVANIASYMFTHKITSNPCNLNYNINLYLIHFT